MHTCTITRRSAVSLGTLALIKFTKPPKLIPHQIFPLYSMNTVHSEKTLRKKGKSFSEYYDLSLQLVMLALDKVEALVRGRNHSLVS